MRKRRNDTHRKSLVSNFDGVACALFGVPFIQTHTHTRCREGENKKKASESQTNLAANVENVLFGMFCQCCGNGLPQIFCYHFVSLGNPLSDKETMTHTSNIRLSPAALCAGTQSRLHRRLHRHQDIGSRMKWFSCCMHIIYEAT